MLHTSIDTKNASRLEGGAQAQIIPVILAGGTGTRLWPSSRKSFPKQFTGLVGEQTLFQDTLCRLGGPGFAAPTIVTGGDFRFIVAQQIEALGTEDADILLEPQARNTAAAILTAALRHEATPDAVLLVAPSDQRITNEAAFLKAVAVGADQARDGEIVTLGIKPTHPEPGYGYLELTEEAKEATPQPLRSFVEKPTRKTAETLIASGKHLWNAGIFMFRVDTIIRAFETLAPDLVAPCRSALETGERDLSFYCLGSEAYARCDDISIDYAIMEAAEALEVVPMDCGWRDLGSWCAVHGTAEQDGAGNALSEQTTQVDCKGTLLRSDCPDMRVVGVGLEHIGVVATKDAVLVVDLNNTEKVKEAVTELRREGAPQADSFRQCHRPWGHYETLALSSRFQVKKITVQPGGVLSLQSHHHRSEHWIVVSGTARVTIGETVQLVTENQSVYVPLGAIHRMENPGKVPMELIEVQTGAYLGEDDIERFEDVYGRN